MVKGGGGGEDTAMFREAIKTYGLLCGIGILAGEDHVPMSEMAKAVQALVFGDERRGGEGDASSAKGR